MIGRFPYKLLSKYPHMKPADVAIWERFIPIHPLFFDSVDYDFHVGEGADFLPTGEDTPEGRENRLYQKKIDVVGYKDDIIQIVEVKPNIDMFALGQILTYKELFVKKIVATSLIFPVVIGANMPDEMREVYANFEISYYIV